MLKVKIIADSTCDLSPSLTARYDIAIAPLHVTLGDKSYKDMVEITPDEVFKWSEENKTTPKTSAVTIAEITDLFNGYTALGYEIVYISISSDMSASYGVAALVANETGKNIAVVDSRNLSTGIGHIVIKAAEMAQAGLNCFEIKNKLEEIIPRVRASFVVDTVTYLHRGGRCSAVAALSATALSIKPTIVVKDGQMRPDVKYHGRIEKVLLKYAENMTEKLLKADKSRVFVTHTRCKDDVAIKVVEYLTNLHYFDEILETEAGCVISSHCGPGTLGILYIEGE